MIYKYNSLSNKKYIEEDATKQTYIIINIVFILYYLYSMLRGKSWVVGRIAKTWRYWLHVEQDIWKFENQDKTYSNQKRK